MLRSRFVCSLLLLVSTLLVAGCAHKGAPRPPIASGTALNWRVNVSSLQRRSDGQVEVALLITRLRPDPAEVWPIGPTLAILPTGKGITGPSDVRNLWLDTQSEVIRYRIPKSVKRLDIARDVISHVGSRFKFGSFTNESLPLTMRSGKCYLSVRQIGYVRMPSSEGYTPYLVFFLDMEVPSGFEPGAVKLRDDRGRLAMMEEQRQLSAKPNVWRFSCPWGDARLPRRFTLEAACAREVHRWVRFRDLPIASAE